ncbi:MAG: N-acetyltransferase [Candidatus Marinimicrobia bacterium]|nr:N-acetyltransferase [Candidatus Neomarinimicrobiota bacterium]
MDLIIRLETPADYGTVEDLTRESFWNVHVPGCDEHYLVHKMRYHPDFIPELDFVAVYDDKIVGSIIYTKSRIIDDALNEIGTITFGPLCVLPEYQKCGIGSALINHSRKVSLDLGYRAIIIEGHPHNYCKHGFKGSKTYNIADHEGKYPYSLLVLELEKGFLSGQNWKYYSSDVFQFDADAAAEFDAQFPYKEKKYATTQEEFQIASQAFIL